MQILLYNELDSRKIPSFSKLKKFLEADDFRSAEVKKIAANLYRAKLDSSNRLLFAIYRYQHQAYALILECIEHHAYEKSRFLSRGVTIDETKIPLVKTLQEVPEESLVFLNSTAKRFNLLDKVISFDSCQQEIYALQPPLIVIGSAGSGKTALTLEKMKEAVGDVLYVTQSSYLVKNSRDLYYAHHYENEDQQVDFLSFQEFLESIHVPAGKEVTFADFNRWFSRRRQASGISDAYKLFEEFKGVLTGSITDAAWMDHKTYLSLGVKQSIFTLEEREQVYAIFEKYLVFLRDEQRYDANIVSFEYLSRLAPRYDFVVIDEVQDITNIQLSLILRALRNPNDFVICGDSNQIVHPNFFSWSKVKSFFHRHADKANETKAPPGELIRVLNTNYRNSPQVTEIANRLLKIKNARFGSIDKESNYLVESNGHNQGQVHLLRDSEKLKQELDRKTCHSTRFAIVVMQPERKTEAKRFFQTPLVFSVQEAKGLEYENVILLNFISAEEQRFQAITKGVDHSMIETDMTYGRVKDKSDKSLEVYKFHINSLYVAITRAVKNLYIVESAPKQRLLDLLGLKNAQDTLELAEQGSSFQEWQHEAHKLELQGKAEQAEQIRSQILKQKEVEWEVLAGDAVTLLRDKAIVENNKKAKLALYEYALVYRDQMLINDLLEVGFAPARNLKKGIDTLNQKYYMPYSAKNPTAVLRQVDRYGADFRNQFNQTPLMIAARLGNAELTQCLTDLGADTELLNNSGFNGFQIALEQACSDNKFAAKKLGRIYNALEPASMSIQVEGKLLKLDNHLMEFLMLNLIISIFYEVLPSNYISSGGAFSTKDFVNAIQTFPDSVVPARRKKRAYISSILSKNEINRDGPYNRKLFLRVKHGQYIINPDLSVRVGGEWKAIYNVLRLDLLAYRRRNDDNYYAFHNYDERVRNALERMKNNIRLLAAGKDVIYW